MTTTPPPPTVVGPLSASLVAAVGVWGTWRFFVTTTRGRTLDEQALAGSTIGAGRLDSHALTLLDTVSIPAVAITIAVVVLIGALRKEWLLGFLAAGAVGMANVTTQVLKYLVLDRPNLPGVPVTGPNSLPSGHTTVAAAAALGLLLVVPPVLRTATAFLGAILVSAFGFATLVNQWHRPSDVVAAVLVAATWAFLAVTVHRIAARRRLERNHPGVGFVVLLLLGIVAAGVAAGAGYLCWGQELATTRWYQFVAYTGGAALLAAAACCGSAMLLAMLHSAKRR